MRGTEECGGWFELQEDGNAVEKVEEQKWYEITQVMATRYTLAGTLYFDLVVEDDGPGDRCGQPRVAQDDVTDADQVAKCFEEVGELIVESLERKKSTVIALAGLCGCGKSTELARIIHKHAPKVTRFIVEARRKVAVNNAHWMHKGKKAYALSEWKKQGNEEEDFVWPQEFEAYESLVDLYVGVLYAPPPGNMVVVTKMDVTEELLRVKSNDDADGRTIYLTTGTLQNIATSILRRRSKLQKGIPVVLIMSDWEDKTMEVGQCLVDFKRLCKILECPFVIVMASQAHLEDPWLSWVTRGLGFKRKYAPASLAEYYSNPERTFSTKRFLLHEPSTLNALEMWEQQLFKLTISQCWGLLRSGGCMIVKVVAKSHCFRLAHKFSQFQDELIRAGIFTE